MQALQQSLIFIIGILLTSSLFYLILYFGFRRKLALLFLSLFCICQAAKAFFRTDGQLAMQMLSWSEDSAIQGTGFIYTLGGFFLISFLIHQFETPHKAIFLSLCAGVQIVHYLAHWSQLPLVLTIGLSISLYAFRRERLGALLSATGLLLFGLVTYLEIELVNQVGYFIGTIAFILCMTLFVGHQIREQIRMQQAALLRSSALENQLLKKSLQPHFLFNSLMSLQEWIESKPSEAAQFVQALAEEFRSVCKMSGKQLISIDEELAMCRSHLQIMSYRKRAQFELTTKGISGDEQVPPAIFHTLIENGLTHGFAERQHGQFILSKSSISKGHRYELFNDGQAPENGLATVKGTGLKYVEARLEESFPQAWQLQTKIVKGGWLVQIDIQGQK